MNLSKKKYTIILSGIIPLFVGVLFYISLPYINNWRSQYSSKLEASADVNPDKQRDLLRYLEANFLSKRESLSLKIGKIYDDAGKPELAERYFANVRSDKYLDKLTEHYLKTGDIEKAKATVQKTNDPYYSALLTFIYNPTGALKEFEGANDENSNELKEYTQTIKSNPQSEFTDTAIALYLYNNGYENLALQKLESYLDKDYKEALVLLGNIYYEKSLYKNSATAYEKAIELDKYDLETHKNLDEVYQKLENKEKLAEISVTIDRLEVNPK